MMWSYARPVALSLAFLFVAMMAPGAGAGSAGCGDAAAVSAPDGSLHVYWDPSTIEVWEESNPLPGLQRGPCDDGNGRMVPPDTLVAATPFGISQPPPSG